MNMTERVIAEVDITYKDGTSKYTVMEAKALDEIGECEKGTIVLLMEESGDNLTGIFVGTDGELILLSSVDDENNILAFRKEGLQEFYFEEIDEMPEGESEIIQNFEE